MRKPLRHKPFTLARGAVSTRSRVHNLVDRLDLPVDWTVEEFFASVERTRGRRIRQLPLPQTAPVGLCGLWLACADHDVILFRQSSDPGVELHVVLHEVGHMLFDHGRDMSMSPAGWTALTRAGALDGKVDLPTIRAARGMSSYAAKEEYEAELLATLIGLRARTAGPRRDRMLKEL